MTFSGTQLHEGNSQRTPTYITIVTNVAFVTSRLTYERGGMTDNMLDDNVLGSVDNQENVEAPHDREHDPRRRRRRDTVLHQPQLNINQVRPYKPLVHISIYSYVALTFNKLASS